jgi:integrase
MPDVCGRERSHTERNRPQRRLNATILVAEGVNLRTAQSRLGHSDPRLTLAVYAQATDDSDRAAADLIGARFDVPTSRIRAVE